MLEWYPHLLSVSPNTHPLLLHPDKNEERVEEEEQELFWGCTRRLAHASKLIPARDVPSLSKLTPAQDIHYYSKLTLHSVFTKSIRYNIRTASTDQLRAYALTTQDQQINMGIYTLSSLGMQLSPHNRSARLATDPNAINSSHLRCHHHQFTPKLILPNSMAQHPQSVYSAQDTKYILKLNPVHVKNSNKLALRPHLPEKVPSQLLHSNQLALENQLNAHASSSALNCSTQISSCLILSILNPINPT
ncbi:hypothetical protein F511_09488 [Dorcoceras hygrometricum]|uniref:Uncharacterized protein n=1 Tax=Dorcoceras hygrometricum TaxID=472368 RepID=A0A2Z7CTN0_9LAMI|nr:hypothetical protein F511_09488 [Dorcoceras hygrometricum]